MPLLTLQEILNTRLLALAKANPVVTGGASLSVGAPSSSVTAISTPPKKKIFSILSWNIKDYKGSKIVAEKRGKEDNPFVNQFIKMVLEELKTDLLLMIETDIDASEAISRIEDERDTGFGYLALNPSANPTLSISDPYENPTAKRDDNFYAEVKKRVEALAGTDSMYWPVTSELAFKKVNLPDSFTFDDLQSGLKKLHPGGPTREDGQLWWEDLRAVCRCYNAEFKKSPITVNDLVNRVSTTKKSSDLDKRFQFKLRKVCPVCNGAKRQPSSVPCELCDGSTRPMDWPCPECRGAKQKLAWAPCGACNGNKTVSVQCPVCLGSGNCGKCGGTGGVKCPSCGGPVQVGCPSCGGHGVVGFGMQCTNCGGRGWGFMPPNCMACNRTGFVFCPTCKGAKACGNCGGQKMVNQTCGTCFGHGTVQVAVPCGNCGATGINPIHFCPSCKGTTWTACVGCAGPSCTVCGGKGQVACMACNSSGLVSSSVCNRCEGDGTESACRECGATGTYDDDSESAVLQTLRNILTPESFPNIDTETYAVMWRKGSVSLPGNVIGGLLLACEDKAVWLDPNQTGLQSKDEKGQELGYQDPKKDFNSRMPFVILLYMDLNGNKRRAVPLVVFHAIWGEVTKMNSAAIEKVVTGRADSVRRLRQLGVKPVSSNAIPIHKADGSILVGDFNLDYNPSKVARDSKGYSQSLQSKVMKVFEDLANDKYVAKTGGTPSGLTPSKYGVSRLSKPNKKGIYTYAYDTILVKGTDLVPNVVQCGVFDAIKLIESYLKKDPSLVKWIDNIIDKKKLNDAARAYYIYYNYVSDHMPVMIDFLVDEIDPQYKTRIEEQKKYSLGFLSNWNPVPEPKQERYLGKWTSLSNDSSPSGIKFSSQDTFGVVGEVTVVASRPGMVCVSPGGNMIFLGKIDPKPSVALLGQRAKGVFVADSSVTGIRASDYFGSWLGDLAVAGGKTYAFEQGSDTDSDKAKVRGIVKWVDSRGNVTVAVKLNDDRSIYLQGPGKLASGADVGSFVEGIFERSK